MFGIHLYFKDPVLIQKVDKLMATVQEIKDAIAAEAAEVKAKVDALEQKIVELTQAGGGASAAELDQLLSGVRGIFNADSAPI